jgi:hypothetical protein
MPLLKKLRSAQRQETCTHPRIEESSFNGITRWVCTDCAQVSFESTADSIHVGGVPSPRHVVDES